MQELLKGVQDTPRILQKLLLRRGYIDDLVAIRESIDLWSLIKGRLALEQRVEGSILNHPDWTSLDNLFLRMRDLSALSQRLSSSLEDASKLTALADVSALAQDLSSGSSALEDSSLVSESNWTINPK